jgi:hypothetical protein
MEARVTRFRRTISAGFVGALGAAAILALAAPALAWQTAHGAPDNTGTVNVRTARAATPIATNAALGDIAPGAGPVIAPDGTLYLGNMQGTLMSFRPDGAPAWTRDIGGFQSILTSPAIGSDGSIYVIGSAFVRDNTTSPATQKRITELHKFTAGGGWLWHRPFPGTDLSGVLPASPNILQLGGSDVVIVPSGGTYAARLTAFSGDSGAILAHHTVTNRPPSISGGASWEDVMCAVVQVGGACGFSTSLPGSPQQDRLPAALKVPFPAVAVYTPADGTPMILMSDGFQDLVGFSFNGNAFEERFRVHDDKRYLSSPPLAWPDGHAMINTGGYETNPQVMYAGLGFSTIRAAASYSQAAPAALGNSRHSLVERFGGLTIMSGVTILRRVALPGHSIAAAAASQNLIFVSTASALHTFDKAKLTLLASFSWSGGGVAQPVIGPQGHVYAIANDILYVFAPPSGLIGGVLENPGTLPQIEPVAPQVQPLPQPSGGVMVDRTMPGLQSAPQLQQVDPQSLPEIQQDLPSRAFEPPLTASGNRLFACLELDGNDCGNTQMRDVAAAFCQTQGFDRAEDLDVDSRRVTAETLDGRLCSKKKCRVFDQIVCRK